MGASDAFVARLTADGQTLDRSTYLGGTGSGPEAALGVASRPDGGLLVLGETWSADFPVRDPLQDALAGQSDAFVAALPEALDGLEFSMLLGGSDIDVADINHSLAVPDDGAGIAVGPDGAMVMALCTLSTDFPTKDCFSCRFPSGVEQAAVVKIDVVPPEPPTAEACTFVNNRAPAAAIADALANPDGVPGWGMLCNPSVPPSRINVLRTWLSLQNISMPYHPVGNGLVYKCRCP
jgi:hypothetical protein